jgi:hypothetical protein
MRIDPFRQSGTLEDNNSDGLPVEHVQDVAQLVEKKEISDNNLPFCYLPFFVSSLDYLVLERGSS